MDYDIAEAFRRIELELISSMKRNWQKHNEEENKYGFTWSRWQAEQLKSLEEFKKKNPRLFSSEFKAINEQFLDSILSQKETNFFGVHSRKVQALVKATTGDLVKAEHAMLRKANDEYRKVIYNAQTYLASGAGTLDKAVDMASNDFLTRGINCVVYKGGRHVNMATYSEMSLRTTNKRIGMYADGAKRQELGVHTVKVSKYGMCSKTCQPWQGRVYVDDVYSGGTPEEAEELNLPLLSTAISGGLFHPNCKHHLSTYYPGMDNDDDGDPRQPTYENPPGTQEHHYLQHQIQRERRLQVGSLSEDKIKEHADKEQQLIGLDEKYVKQAEQYTNYRSRFFDKEDNNDLAINNSMIHGKTGNQTPKEYLEYRKFKDSFEKIALPADKVVPKLRGAATEWVNSLTEAQKYSINKYTYNSIDDRENQFYFRLNQMLNGDQPYDAVLEKHSRILSEAISKFDLKENVIAYRSVDIDLFKDVEIGELVKLKPFMSTSVSKSGTLNKEYKIELYVSAGTRCAYIEELSEFKKQRELLIDKNTWVRLLYKQGSHTVLEVLKL